MSPDLAVYAIIAVMAVVTYITRIAGHAILQRAARRNGGAAKPSPFMDGWIRALPGCILTAIVLPALFRGGPADLIAGAATLAVAIKTRHLFAAMTTGVVTVFVLRHII